MLAHTLPLLAFLTSPLLQLRDPHACTLQAWSAPTFVSGLGAADIRNPRISVSRHGLIIIVGNKTPDQESPESIPQLGIWKLERGRAGRLNAVGIPAPSGTHWFGYPIATFDRQNRLHVLWAEPADSLKLRRTSQPLGALALTVIWHASFSAGRWTTPQRIAIFESARWTPTFISSLIPIGGRGVAVAVPTFSKSAGGVVTFLSGSDAHWARHDVPLALPVEPSYTDLAIASSGRIIVSYAAAETGLGRDINSVFAISSNDGGSHWSHPRLVSRSGRQPTFDQRLVAVDDGAALIWTKSRSQSEAPDLIQAARNADRGDDWSKVIGTEANYPRHLFVVKSPCDHPLAFFEAAGTDGATLTSVSLRRLGFAETQVLFPLLRSVSPSAASDGRCIHLLWLAAPRSSTPIRPMLAYSTACAERPDSSATP